MNERIVAELREVVAMLRATIGKARGAQALARLEDATVNEATGLLLADDRGRYVWANAASARLLGYSKAGLLRLSVWDVTPIDDATDIDLLWRMFLRSGYQSGAYPIRSNSDRVKWVYYYAEPHLLPGLHISAIKPVRPSRSRTSRCRLMELR